MSIGQRIKSMRVRQGLSIDELACKLGKNRTTIYRYENGDIENLPLGILDSLANALNTTPAYLMGWENSNGMCHGHDEDIVFNIKHIETWRKEFSGCMLTEEESQKLIEYARFLISIRETK